LNIRRPSERAFVRVILGPQEELSDHPAGYYEWPNGQSGTLPSLAVGHLSAASAMEYIAGEVLPFIEPMRTAAATIKNEIGMRITSSGAARLTQGAPRFRDMTRIAEGIVEQIELLDATERSAVRSTYGEIRFKFSADPTLLHAWGSRANVIIVGRDRIAEMFPYLLTRLPAQQREIETLESSIRSDLNVAIRKSDPYLAHATYIEALNAVLESTAEMGEDQLVAIRESAVYVQVGGRWITDVGLRNRRHELYMTPAGARRLLDFVIANADALESQEPRRN